MIFNSIQFLIFFGVVALLYFILPFKWRWSFLLLASYYFYMCWNPIYISLIILSTLITFYTAKFIGPKNPHRKLWLVIGIIANLSILLIFKYLGFFTEITQSTLDLLHIPTVLPKFNLLLPLGISFHTFQTIGYVIDVYKGKKDAETHLGYYALFVSFFPQLVAGPIERSATMLPQFKIEHKFDYQRIVSGLRLATWGMFKKIVIADRASIIVDTIYNNPTEYSGAALAIATLAFAFQIYCDFSGYTDIAIGTARILGFNLTQNFNRPYSARSIADFWRRWHISLTSWFKDYIYIPLGGNRVPLIKWTINIMLVFLISGLWHGAAWTFIIWGALHGIWQILEKLILSHKRRGGRPRPPASSKPNLSSQNFGLRSKPSIITNSSLLIANFISWLITFAFVCITWIFFRAGSLSDAHYIFTQIFTNWNFEWLYLFADNNNLLILALSIIAMEIAQKWLARLKTQNRTFQSLPAATRWFCYYSLLFAIFLFAEYGSQEFIYFQF